MTVGELIVGIGTLALAIFTYMLVREEQQARKENLKPKFGLTGWSYVLNTDIPGSLWLQCLSGIAKQVEIEYAYNDDVTKKYALSLAEGEMVVLDRDFRSTYEKGGSIQIKIKFQYDSDHDVEELGVNIEDIKTGDFKLSRVIHKEATRPIQLRTR